ncbi:hypothetical protein ACHAPT_008464 [Fusarium lateritium]
MSSSTSLDPTPKTITGGCLCSSIRYKITFPESHDFAAGNCICQCTQCRKQTGGLFYASYSVPTTALEWTSDTTKTLKKYHATEGTNRGFCQNCGTFLFWHPEGSETISFSIGSVDALYLFGEGAGKTGNNEVPQEGFGRALCSGLGNVEWCCNDIKGVTDDMPLLLRGTRHQGDSRDD